jgi:hypothetical protein
VLPGRSAHAADRGRAPSTPATLAVLLAWTRSPPRGAPCTTRRPAAAGVCSGSAAWTFSHPAGVLAGGASRPRTARGTPKPSGAASAVLPATGAFLLPTAAMPGRVIHQPGHQAQAAVVMVMQKRSCLLVCQTVLAMQSIVIQRFRISPMANDLHPSLLPKARCRS